jgi:hypothetical protein
MNDAKRQGVTIRPFNENQSWSLLLKLLGKEWEERERAGLMKGHEEDDGKAFLRDMGGVWN